MPLPDWISQMPVSAEGQTYPSQIGRSTLQARRHCGEVCLVLLDGKQPTQSFDLTHRDHASIGRHAENHIVVSDATCSRRQCVLAHVDGAWFVEDLLSRNGTFVNGRRIFSEYMLCDGDEIQIGTTVFRFFEIPVTDV